MLQKFHIGVYLPLKHKTQNTNIANNRVAGIQNINLAV